MSAPRPLFVPHAGKLFDESGAITDAGYHRRADKFLKELVWMARVLRHGRENVTA